MFRVSSWFLCLFLTSLFTATYAETSAKISTTQHSTAAHVATKASTTTHLSASTAAQKKSTTHISKKQVSAKKPTQKKHSRTTSHTVASKHSPNAHRATRHSGAITEAINISDLREFADSSPAVKDLIIKAQKLSEMHLTYLYGSAHPRNRGMDCSGTIYYLLNETPLHGIPRQSDQIFDWMERLGKIHPVDATNFNSPDFSHLKPGDLLFWSGTYVTHRVSPITHVMLYLGTNRQGQHLMFGSSDGRSYQGKRIRGVSVFDFKLPSGKGKQRFVGYGCIPGLTCE